MSDGTNEAALRALVREALRDVLPELLATAAGAAPRVEPVRLSDDADLAAFAARVLAAADDVRSGRLVFRLAATDRSPAPDGPSAPAPAPDDAPAGHRVDRGAVTERHVRAAERAGGLLLLGPRAVLTPLARDRVRAAGVDVVRAPAADGHARPAVHPATAPPRPHGRP